MKKQPLPASTQPLYVGVDFAKAKFDFHGAGLTGSLPNDPAGHRRFLAKLPTGVHLICESTGSCHRALVRAAHGHGVPLTVANPRQVRDFLKGMGQRAKTDPLDARGLEQFGQHVRPEADQKPTATLLALQELVVAREQTVEERSKLKVQAAGQTLPFLRARTKARLRALDKEVARLEQAIRQALTQDSALADKATRLKLVRGVGPVSAATCVALCPELGTLSDGEAAALLGVAPYDDESGQTTKARRISGGRFRLRCALYMAALSATRFNPILRRFYLQLRGRHKPAKVAITAVMRKLIILLNRLVKQPDFQLA